MSALSVAVKSAVREHVAFDEASAVRTAWAATVCGAAGGVVALVLTSQRELPAPALGVGLALMGLVLSPLRLSLRVAAVVSALFVGFFVPHPELALPVLLALVLGVQLGVGARGGRLVLTVIAPVLGAAWFLAVAALAATRHEPAFRLFSLALAPASGVFVGVALMLARLDWHADRVEAVLQRLGEPAERVRDAWGRIRAALRLLPAGAERAELEALTRAVALRWVEHHGAAEELRAVLSGRGLDVPGVKQELEALETKQRETSDGALRGHLEQALRVHRDTLEQVDGLQRRAERFGAQAAGDAAFLEKAALSVELAPRNTPMLREVVTRLASLSPARGGVISSQSLSGPPRP